MKILWFTNTPCSSAVFLGQKNEYGGWLSSLENQIIKEVDVNLYIAFYSNFDKRYYFNKTNYFSIKRNNRLFKIWGFVLRYLKINDKSKYDVTKLLKIINEINPDIIHIHGTEENYGLIQNFTNIPTVLSIQGLLLPYYEKYYSGIPRDKVSKYTFLNKTIRLKSANSIFYQYNYNSKIERKIISICKNIIGRTDWDRRIISLLNKNCIYITGNEILRESFYLNRWNKNKFDSCIKLVTVSSNGIYKGFETILRTANELNINGIKINWDVIGLNENDEIVHICEKWLKIKSENVNVRLLGRKSESEIVQIFLNSDIFCQVSHIENSSNSLCEAMLVGMPIIATFAGGTDSILENKKEGLLVQEGDSFSFAGAICELFSDYNKAKIYSEAAFLKANIRHNKVSIVQNLINTYNNLIIE